LPRSAGFFRSSNESDTVRVVDNAETQTDIARPHDHAARRAWFDRADTVADDANGRNGSEEAAAEKTITQERSRPGCQSADHAAQFAAEAAAGPEGLMPAASKQKLLQFRRLISSIEIEKIPRPMLCADQ
jgi:hypothetical protein